MGFNNFEGKGRIPTKLCHMTLSWGEVKNWGPTFGGNFGEQKTSKIWRNLGQLLTLVTNISGIGQGVDNLKQT